MSPREIFALRDYLDPALKGRFLSDARQIASLTDIAGQTCLQGRLAELSGKSVLLAIAGQFLSALAILEIDGVARRMLLCPPDLRPDHVEGLLEDAGIDAKLIFEPGNQDGESERIETGLVKRKLVVERRQSDLLLGGDLLQRRKNL